MTGIERVVADAGQGSVAGSDHGDAQRWRRELERALFGARHDEDHSGYRRDAVAVGSLPAGDGPRLPPAGADVPGGESAGQQTAAMPRSSGQVPVAPPVARGSGASAAAGSRAATNAGLASRAAPVYLPLDKPVQALIPRSAPAAVARSAGLLPVATNVAVLSSAGGVQLVIRDRAVSRAALMRVLGDLQALLRTAGGSLVSIVLNGVEVWRPPLTAADGAPTGDSAPLDSIELET